MLDPNAPQLRTAEKLIEKHEQIADALEHGSITAKVAEQLNQSLKGIVGIERLGMSYLKLALAFGKKAPVPRTPILRSMIGLPVDLSPHDGETVRAMLPGDTDEPPQKKR